MSLTRPAVARPITTLMISLMVILLGWHALQRLTVDLMPDITYPTISVTTVYAGAGPEEIETLITRPLEQTISAVQGVERLISSSVEGSSTIRVRLTWDADIDGAISDLRARIARLRPNLPDQIEPPYIRRFDVADFPIIYLGIASPLDAIEITRLTEQTIVPQLERINGVASVRVRGGVRREIHVKLDREKLEALDMSVNEVVATLQRENVNQPAGDFEQGNLNLLIRSRGEFHSLSEIAETVIRESAGAVVRVGDVAEVVDGQEKQTERTRVDGQAGLLVYLNKQAGANTIAVSDRVHAAIDRINRSVPQAELLIRMDRADYIRQAVANVQESGLYGMGLAILVLIVFLRSFRSTLVIAISMPLSVLATFVMIYFKGFTLNMVSFGGLALGIGLLVDNSIVVLESIFRQHDLGLDSRTAAITGTEEVSGAIIASTLTTLIVFLPLLFIEGTTGIIVHQLAWVVSFSLICSLLASLTLTPVLAAWWLQDSSQSDVDEAVPAAAKLSADGYSGDPSAEAGSVQPRTSGLVAVIHRQNEAIFGAIESAYAWLLRGSLRWSPAVGFLLLLSLAVTVGLTPYIGSEFLPKTDEGDLRVFGNMAPGIQLPLLDEQARRLEQRVMQAVPESETVAAFIGGGADDADDWNEVFFRLHLLPRSERERSVEDIRRDLSEKLGGVPGMKLRVQVRSDMLLTRALNPNNGGDIMIEVRGHDLDSGERLAQQIAERMEAVDGLVNVEVALEDRRPELAARIDRAKASRSGVSVQDITQALETTIRGSEATVFREGGDEFNVRVQLQEQDRRRLADVEQIGIATTSGRIIPLKSVVRFEHGDSPAAINRLDQQRVISISADVEDRDLGSVVGELQQQLEAVPLPPGFVVNIAGDWEDQQRSFEALRTGLLLAVLLMYMIMASQFESLIDPLMILLTIPLGAVGVIVIMLASGTTLNVQSFIGLVMLAGIVVNNAIVLIDYLNLLRRREPETPLEELIIRAGVRRFRPILMTTLTTVLAMLPIALGWGEGGELQAPMARVVIGGLISGTLITLIAIPLVARWRHGMRLDLKQP